METNFRHYLITRYNVPLAGWEKDKHGVDTRDEAWLAHRFHLFSTYCFPSVVAQSNAQFTWLIYMDQETPRNSLHPLEMLIQPHANISLRRASGYFECLADINTELQQAGAAFVITSRLDNDDAIGHDYISRIQQAFKPQHGMLINLLHGHGYDITRQVAMRLRHIRKNAFMSLIEKCNPDGNHISIRGFQHDHPPEHFTMTNLTEPFGWLKIFHDRNLKSEAFGRPVWANTFAHHYGVAQHDLPINRLRTARYFVWWLQDGIRRKWRMQRKKSGI
jgi:hypothetical protein